MCSVQLFIFVVCEMLRKVLSCVKHRRFCDVAEGLHAAAHSDEVRSLEGRAPAAFQGHQP